MTNRRTDERATPARTRTAPGDASLPASHATLPTAGHTDVHQSRLCLESWLQAYITARPPSPYRPTLVASLRHTAIDCAKSHAEGRLMVDYGRINSIPFQRTYITVWRQRSSQHCVTRDGVLIIGTSEMHVSRASTAQ